jgi:hypothetical protein
MDMPASALPLDAVPDRTHERLWPALIVAPSLAWLADFLFWPRLPGAPLGFFSCVAATLVLVLHARRGRRRRPAVACALLAVASFATVCETSFTNTVVLVSLLVVVVGESFYADVAGTAWARWLQALISGLCAMGRWPWLVGRLATSALVQIGLGKSAGDFFARSLQTVAPAVCLGAVFLVVFQLGNAVFREFCSRISASLIGWIQDFDFSPQHLVFWFAASTVALALVQPRSPVPSLGGWTRQWSRVGRKDRTVAVWQSRFTLLVLNALFFAVNTIDAAYLWQHAKLPVGVTFSAFVHSGVFSLIFATLLSALVLATMFQQSVEIVRARGLQGLALLWIGQNLMLIAGVFLRLKLYVEAYQLSTLRVYVGCFLLLVTAGFVLLAWHITRDGSLNALIFRNVLASFALFFVVQFPDVSRAVAQFNVAQWRHDPSRTLDTAYLESLGPGGWRALCAVALTGGRVTPDILDARQRVRQLAAAARERRAQSDWRSFQWRREAADRELLETDERLVAHPGS